MQTSELSGLIRKWAAEFGSIRGEQVVLPDGLCAFLASRISEQGGAAQPDPDTVRVKIGSEFRMVRPIGTMPGALLRYEHADGTIGMGCCPVRDVHPDDRGKLSQVLERLLQDGKVRSAPIQKPQPPDVVRYRKGYEPDER